MNDLNDIPTLAPRITRSWDGVWLLMVRCPYCLKLHTHGGGDDAQPGRFGGRVSHCTTGDRGVYVIVRPEVTK